jgi:hypothetical protein
VNSLKIPQELLWKFFVPLVSDSVQGGFEYVPLIFYL